MVKKIKAGLIVTGGILLLAIVVLALMVPRLVPGDLIADQITNEVERATGATVTLGEASLQWAWGWRLALREGSVRGTGEALTAATGSPNDLESYAIEFEEFGVVPALLPLLRKQVVVKEVRLAGPRLVVGWPKGEAKAAGFEIRLTDLNLGLDPASEAAGDPRGDRKPAPGNLIPADLDFSFTATFDTLVLQRVPYTQVGMRGGFTEKILAVNELSAFRSTGTVTGNLTINYEENPWGQLVFKAEVQEVPATALLEPWAPEIGNRLECELNSELSGTFDLRDRATVLRTLNIDGLVDGGPGILHAGDWLQDVTPYLGNRQDLKEVRFKDLTHQFLFHQGRYLIKGLTLAGGDTEWWGQGWVDLEGNIAMGIDVKLPAGFTPDLGNFSFLAASLRDAEGRINLPLKLSVRSNRPTVGVDLGRLRAR